MEQKDLEELNILFEKESVSRSDIGDFSPGFVNTYLNALLVNKSDPEASVTDIVRALFSKLSPQSAAGPGSIDLVEDTLDQGKIGVEIKKYLEYDPFKKILIPTDINPYINTKKSIALKEQIFKYCKADFDYIILTNLKKWYIYDPAYCNTKRKTKPFIELDLNNIYKYLNSGFTIDKIRRVQNYSTKIDLGDAFYNELCIVDY